MTAIPTSIVSGSLVALIALLLWRTRAHGWHRDTFFGIGAIGTAVILLNTVFGFPFPTAAIAARGAGGGGTAILLYLAMVAGMFAHGLFGRFSRPMAIRPPFDLGLLLAPVFASPIVFIPLLVALENADFSSRDFTTAQLMLFLVSFQNGFFWKEFFDNRSARTAPQPQRSDGEGEQ